MKRSVTGIACILIALSLTISGNSYADFAKQKDKSDKSSKRKSSETKVAELPTLQGPKKNIAVMDFENKAGVAAQWELGTGMAEMLTTALFDSGRFVLVERQAINDVIAEQDFGASGRTTEAGAATIGKILNAQVLIRGAVTEFSFKSQDAGSLVSFAGVNLGLSGSNAHVAINIRLYDSTTGEVIESMRVEGKASAGGISGGYSGMDLGGLNFGTSAFYKTPLGKATQKTIDQAVYLISQKMQEIPWEGKIVTVKDDTVYINAGETSNVRVGDGFTVYNKGEELVDPDTGISLGSEDSKAGRIEIFNVEEKFSKAHAIAGSPAGFKRGDIVKIQ